MMMITVAKGPTITDKSRPSPPSKSTDFTPAPGDGRTWRTSKGRYPRTMAEVQTLSRATYDRLRAELEELTGEGRIDIAHKIEAARALGDLSENGDYHAAKEQQGKMEARIRQITGTLQDAVVVDAGATGNDRVVVGTVVTLRFEGDDDTERFLVGSIEERHDDAEVLSPGSPLGQAVMGASAGERRTYEVNGNQLGIEIVAIEPG